MFNPIAKIKAWLALSKAKKLEKEALPTDSQLKNEQKQFVFEATELKKMVTKPKKSKKNI